MTKRLHIGCGNIYLDGWENLDIFSSSKADIYSSALVIPRPRETYDLIYACHILEHFNRHLIMTVLNHWKDLLKPGGVLRLAVPDFDAVYEYYNDYDPLGSDAQALKDLMGLLYGGQKYNLDEHKCIFNIELLTEYLEKVGFKEIRKWDFREADHASNDDYSQAFLPHMDKESGLHMSLNLEAVK